MAVPAPWVHVPKARPTPLQKIPHAQEAPEGFWQLPHPPSQLLQARGVMQGGGAPDANAEWGERQEVRVYNKEASCSQQKGSRGWRNKQNPYAGIGTLLPPPMLSCPWAGLCRRACGRFLLVSRDQSVPGLQSGVLASHLGQSAPEGNRLHPRLSAQRHPGVQCTRGRRVTSPRCSCDGIIDIHF